MGCLNAVAQVAEPTPGFSKENLLGDIKTVSAILAKVRSTAEPSQLSKISKTGPNSYLVELNFLPANGELTCRAFHYVVRGSSATLDTRSRLGCNDL